MQSHVLVFFKTLSLMNKWSAYLLSALADGETSSTEMSRRIAKMTNGEIFVNAGSINEASKRLIEEGLIEYTEAKRGKIYKLTPKGREMLGRLYRLSDVYRRMLSASE